jgi:hypothetical protein
MANEYSSVGTFGDIRSIEGMLLNKSRSAFERRLYERGKDVRDRKHYKYPLEILSTPDHMNAMCIEIWDNNPAYLATKRETFKRLGESAARAVGASQQNAQNGQAVGDIGDIVGAGIQSAAAAAGAFVGLLSDAFVGGNLQGQGLGRDSYTEEQTGLAGGTAPVMHRIYLYMPTNMSFGYGFEYEDANMSGMDILKLPKALAQGNAEVARDIGKKIAMTNLKILDDLGSKVGIEAGTLGKFFSAQQRQVINPMNLHIFKEVKRREFSFAYTFLPKSRAEMLNCHEIVNILKFFAHPKRSEGEGRFLDYPAEFQIYFLQGDGKNNAYMPYIFKCALKDIKVSYGEETVFSTFESDDFGASPTKMKLDLTFSELEILTRERFGIDVGTVPSA